MAIYGDDYDPLFDDPIGAPPPMGDDPFGDMIPMDGDFADADAAAASAAAGEGEDSAWKKRGRSDPAAEEAFKEREAARERERQSLFSRLNERQAEAVNFPRKSVLVLAGAGSGKTSVLTARIAHLVSSGQTGARNVLAVTFTNKAAQEMNARLRKLLDRRSVMDMWVGTFHGLSNKILRENYEAAGLPKSFAILDTDGQESICRGILKDFGLTKATVKAAAKERAEKAKVDLLTEPDQLAAAGALSADDVEDDDSTEFIKPGQAAKYISSRKEQLEPPRPPSSVNSRSTDVEQMEFVYYEYQARLKKAGLVDFQDLLTRSVEVLKANPEIRDTYRRRFDTILVDETQDTNDLQFEWLTLLKGPNAHIMAVGDDSQSIYAFRGANPENMTRFVKEVTADKDAPEGRIIKLEQNYRSLPHILSAANAVIDRNPGQIKKTLFTTQPDRGEKIDLVTFGNGMFEASSIAESIHTMVRDQKVAPSEIAVLYRTNQQSRLLEQELNKRGVPVTVYGGYRFYDRQEIKHMLAYLDLVADVSRDLSFARVVNFPPRRIGERTVEELRQDAAHKRVSMMEVVGARSAALADNPKALGNAAAQRTQRLLEGFVSVILDLADAATTQPLSQLIETVMERAGIRQHFQDEANGSKSSQEEAEERLANIGELISAARQFEMDNPTLKTAAEQLPEYLAYVALMTSTSEADMSKKQTVTLMTIHSSKGLEFDHVFLAGLEEATFPHARALKDDEEAGNGMTLDEALRMNGITTDDDGNEILDEDADEASAPEEGAALREERRLMYVAVTRARKTLTITHAKERHLNGEPKPCEPSRFLSEIPQHLLRLIDDSQQFRSNKKGNLRSVSATPASNREYGGDGFDNGRASFTAKIVSRPELRTQEAFPAAALSTEGAASAGGSIRAVSKRRDGVRAESFETVIDCDRNHPTLGNRHFLKDINDDDERARVIAAFTKDYEADFAAKGPKYASSIALAERVAGGERIALQCWCKPKDCHCDVIADKVMVLARQLASNATTSATNDAGAQADAPRALTSDADLDDIFGPSSGSVSPDPAAAQVAQTPRSVTDGAPELKPWQRRTRPHLAGGTAPAPAPQPPASAGQSHLKAVPSLVVPRSAAGRVVALIGSAGGGKNGQRLLNKEDWNGLTQDAERRLGAEDTAVSGGAAWVDHLAVYLFLKGHIKHLVLHLPAPLVNGKFVGPRESAASAANFYHDNFTRITGVDGRAEIEAAIAKGATVTFQPERAGYGAFFARNSLVAKDADETFAYTLGKGDTPADGGTKNTWDQIKTPKTHIDINTLPALNAQAVVASSLQRPAAPAAMPVPPKPGASAMTRLNLLGKQTRRQGNRP